MSARELTHATLLPPDGVKDYLQVTLTDSANDPLAWRAFAKRIITEQGLAWWIGIHKPGEWYMSTGYDGDLTPEEACQRAKNALLSILPPPPRPLPPRAISNGNPPGSSTFWV